MYGKEEEEEEVNPSGGDLEMDEVEPMHYMDGGGAGLADLDDQEAEQVRPRESPRSFAVSAPAACTHPNAVFCCGFKRRVDQVLFLATIRHISKSSLASGARCDLVFLARVLTWCCCVST